jgi:hypothetical protein
VVPAEARVRTLIGGVLANRRGTTAVVMTEDDVTTSEEVLLQVTEPSGEVRSWSARIRECRPIIESGVKRFRVRMSLMGQADLWPRVERLAE